MKNSHQLTPICTYNKQVYQVCINPKCKQICFICCDKKCQCKALHQQCDKVDWIYITKKLNRDLIKNTDKFKSFTDTLDQLYQNTIKDITKAYDDFKIWRDDFGLTESQLNCLHLIEQGRFTEVNSAKMSEIRKEIRIPSKIIMKSQNQLKEETELISNYTEKLIQQLKVLYTQNKVIKELVEQKQDKYIVYLIKRELAHKLLGLNQNGSRFFTMVNQGIIEKQLEKILEKINLNEQSIKQNEKSTNNIISNLKEAIGLNIKKLKEIVAENTERINQKIQKIDENCQKLKNSISIQSKIKNLESLLKHKLERVKFNLLSLVETKLFDPSILSTTNKSSILKNEILSGCCRIGEYIDKMMEQYSLKEISDEKLLQELTKVNAQIQSTWKLLEQKIIIQGQNMKMMINISKFFSKKIKKLNQLYKASENNFQVSKFWDKCNGRKNTITILKTQFGKIIGGYSPLAWDISLKGYQQDTSKQSFLFSITQNIKIPLQGKREALYFDPNEGPCFGGGHDLNICDKANVIGDSGTYIGGGSYNNGEYQCNQQTFKNWSGQSNGSSFLIHQWEVYEVIFQQIHT